MNITKLMMIASCVATLMVAGGCGKDATGSAKIQFQQAGRHSLPLLAASLGSPSLRGTQSPVTKLGMKILAVRLINDPDAFGKEYMPPIWTNPSCPDDRTCPLADVEYFDLTDPATANTALNSQNLQIPAKSYNYVQLEMCVGSADSDNIRWGAAGNSDQTAKTIGCAIWSKKAATPIEVKEGGSVTVNLKYDLSLIKQTDDDGECGNVEKNGSFCLMDFDLTPEIATE